MLKMSLSKKVFSGRLQKKTLALRVQLLDYMKKNPKIGCRDIAEIFRIGKTSDETIIKNASQRVCQFSR